jgi:hypothetical protein
MVNVVNFMSEYRWGFLLVIKFIDHFSISLVITLNYSAVANSTLYKITLCIFQLVVSSLAVAW